MFVSLKEHIAIVNLTESLPGAKCFTGNFFIQSAPQTYEVAVVIIPVLQMKELKFRETK